MAESFLVPLIIGIFGGSGVWAFLTRLLDRKDGIPRLKDEMDGRIEELKSSYQVGFNELETRISVLREEFLLDKAIRARIRILRFSDELMENRRRSKEAFEQALDDIDEYEDYCNAHTDFENSRTVVSAKRIKDRYEECLRNNSFL